MMGRQRRDDDPDDRRAQAGHRGDGWDDEARGARADQGRDDPAGSRDIDFSDWYAGSGQRQGGSRGDYPPDSQGQRDRYQGRPDDYRRDDYQDPRDRYQGPRERSQGQRGRYPDDQDRRGAEQDRHGDHRGYAGQRGHGGSRQASP